MKHGRYGLDMEKWANVGQKMLNMELAGRREKGRPEKRFMNVVKEDLKGIG